MSTSGTTTDRGVRRCRFFLAGFLLLPLALLGGGTNGTPDRVVWRLRVGPLFEYSRTREGGTFWALRPLVARVNDPVSDAAVTDVVWPLGTYHRDREQMWWRAALAYGADSNLADDAGAWKAALFPLYFQGRTRQGEDYWALFPIYGHIPHVLLMEDIDFTLFPLYLNYEVKGVEREYFLWPVFSRVAGDEGRLSSFGVFPLYGEVTRREAKHQYLFWPFWTEAVYGGDRNPGESWMVLPLYGEVRREKERQTMVLPPFFSHTKTDSAERWRLPWPFVETVRTPEQRKRSFWPFYGDVEREDERRWYAVWPLIEHFNLTSRGGRTERSRFFPFYVDETVYRKTADGGERAAERYTRLWPFGVREASDAGSRLRVFEFNPIRHSGAIERNWAPFWTLYERTERGGEVTHDALWGLFQLRAGKTCGGTQE